MAIINLKRYYPHYPKDKFLEVPDEVADALEEGRRMEHRQDNRRSYPAPRKALRRPATANPRKGENCLWLTIANITISS